MSGLKEWLRRNLPAKGRVLLHAGPSESAALIAAFQHEPELAANKTFTGLFIPGLNRFDYTALNPTARLETVFIAPSLRDAFSARRAAHFPMHYSNYPGFLERNPADVAILHVPPPRNGVFSCGLAADCIEGILAYARRVIAIINPAMPFTYGASALRTGEIDDTIEIESPLAVFPSDANDTATARIAGHVAEMVANGDTIQCGIGRVPASILRALAHHRNLRVHSGMIIDEIAMLSGKGALVSGNASQPSVITGIAVGTDILHQFCQRRDVAFHGNRITHNIRRIADIPNFVAINSAIEVDLFGQINCEMIGGKQISGIGGGGDFLRAARLAGNGRAITALPAESRNQSRIVPRLTAGTASMARADADCIVTEYGTAQLRDMTADQRAEALIAIAGPDHRNTLANAWRDIRAAM
ncbi:MAG: acetyl-CoA hydrolase/transferase family protein [Beijerinckiaceae bacterium]